MIKKIVFIVFLFSGTFCYSQNFVATYSGNLSGSAGNQNGPVATSRFNSPFGMCIDKYDNLYIADAGNNCIRKVSITTGQVTTFAGTGVAGWKDGAHDTARFNSPADLCIDDSGNVYVSDFLNQRIRKIDSTGRVSTIAGLGVPGFADGLAADAIFDYPRGICRDANGNIFIADSWNHRIRKLDTLGNVSTYAGGGSAMGVGSTGKLIDDSNLVARFFTPSGLTIDPEGNIYVADAYNHRVRKIGINGIVSTVAGSGAIGVSNGGYHDGDTAVGLLNTPTEVFFDTTTNELYIGDTFNNRVRKLDTHSGYLSTFAGNGYPAFVDTIDTLASFDYPRGIVVSYYSGKKIYVNDYSNNAIRIIEKKVIDGFEKINDYSGVIVFPNPFEERMTIRNNSGDLNQYEIISIDGCIIKKDFLSKKQQIEFDLKNFENGIYFLRITSDDGRMFTKKIIKQ